MNLLLNCCDHYVGYAYCLCYFQDFRKCFNYRGGYAEVLVEFTYIVYVNLRVWVNDSFSSLCSEEKHSGTLSAIKDGEGHPGDQQSFPNRI